MKLFKNLFFLSGLMFSFCYAQEGKEQFVQKQMDSTCVMANIPSRFRAQENPDVSKSVKEEEGMAFIKGGTFVMGSTHFEDAQPLHEVEVSSFWMDTHPVTNAQFATFVQETGYLTVAERPLAPKDFPGVDPALLVEGSAVFQHGQDVSNLHNPLEWWDYVEGANWRHPLGKESNLDGKMDHPVVHIAYEDAEAYAQWAGKRLPTEAEWEYAAKAGQHTDEAYYWGEELTPKGEWQANIFQGSFPGGNTEEDGFLNTSPVRSFAANAYGLYDMEGNVWEWCSDFYTPDYYVNSPKKDPQGPSRSYDPMEPHAVKRVQRGGSFLCSDEYCERYKAGGRGKAEVNSPTNNAGFRLVKDIQ